MLRPLTNLKRMSINATDGEIGSVRDTYFDDHTWTVRYVVVDTGRWLPGRKVLLSPWAVWEIDWERKLLDLSLTKDQVRGSPDIDTDAPVSRQHETAYFDFYGYPYYWAGPLRWGPVAFPPESPRRGYHDSGPAARAAHETVRRQTPDPHLRSVGAVTGYHIRASDGSIGHLEDFLYDEQDWSLRFLIIDTRNWLPGGHVIVPIESVERVSWEERAVALNLPRQVIADSPEWKPDMPLETSDETRLPQEPVRPDPRAEPRRPAR
jgi:hypothetical protein